MSRYILVVTTMLLMLSSVISPAMHTRYVVIPQKQAELIQQHLTEIVSKKWGVVTPGDLYHGHLLIGPPARLPKKFRSLEHLFSYRWKFLYHSDEMLMFRWGPESELPLEMKTPRSIMGDLDGHVKPASAFLLNPTASAPNYAWVGSITSRDLAATLPNLITKNYDWEVRVVDQPCFVNLQFDINPSEPEKAMIHVKGMPYRITMDCFDK